MVGIIPYFSTAQHVIKVASQPNVEYYHNLVKAIYDEMGFKAEITVIPAARALVVTNDGEYDALLGSTPELVASSPNLIQTTVPITETFVQAWAKKGSSIRISTPNELKKYRIGRINGIKSTESLCNRLSINAETTNSEESLGNMLDANRIDVALASSVMDAVTLKKYGIIVAPKLDVVQIFHIFNKRNKDLVAKWDKVLKSMISDGRYTKILSVK